MRRLLTRLAALSGAVLLLAGCFTDGSYTIGAGKGQVKPGTWLAPGGSSCQWSTSGPSPQTGSGNGRQQVTIASSDTNFTTKGCGYWEAAGAPQTFTGSGSKVTEPFQLGAGMVIANGTHSGEHNFIVHLVDASGETVNYLANEIGNAQSETLSGDLVAGAYRLEVTADGPWSVTLTQPHSTGGRTLPTTFSGTGNSVVGPFFQSNRGVVFESHYTGEHNFIVTLIDHDGDYAGGIANEIGSSDVSSIEHVNGSYWITVMASGPWTISAHF
jgi:hypothetical protein